MPRVVGGARDIVNEPATSDDMAQVCALLGRLPIEAHAIELDDGALGAQVTWAPFAACIVTGCFSHLTYVHVRLSGPRIQSCGFLFKYARHQPIDHQYHRRLTIRLGNNSATHDTTSLLNAVGSGALNLLESLTFASLRHAYHARLDDEGLDMMPTSLPSLRILRITRCMTVSDAVMAGLLGAAGPNLIKLEIPNFYGGPAAARLIAVEDTPWLGSLQTLSLTGNEHVQMLATAVCRLRSLSFLQVTSLSYDELLVRLMAAAGNGTLQRLPKLELLPMHGECKVSNGARLLVVLWLKEEAKKAVAGQVSAVKWDVRLLNGGRPTYTSKVADKCLAQIKAAWAQIEGN